MFYHKKLSNNMKSNFNKKGQQRKICITGSGIAGAILARQLKRFTSEEELQVVVYEKTKLFAPQGHWTQPVTGAGLNINSNALATLKQIDSCLFNGILNISEPRKSLHAVTGTGEILYKMDMKEEGLANEYGARVRWDDINTLLRSHIDDLIQEQTEVTGFRYQEDGKLAVDLVNLEGAEESIADFDLIISTDGRYSTIREVISGPPEATFGDMCNFRILLPNCNLDGSAFPESYGEHGLFDDLQLVYNELPSSCTLPDDSPLRLDMEFCNTALRSCPRVGIMRIPASKFKPEVGESLYLFGNFAIPKGAKIPKSFMSAEALHCLFTPSSGEESMTPELTFIRDAITSNAKQLHWSRFQDIPVQYTDDKKRVLLLGDSAHGFCPALGQGATTAIEDACVAATHLIDVIKSGGDLSRALELTELSQKDRVSRIKDLSNEAGEHIHFLRGSNDGLSSLLQERDAWKNETSLSSWRNKMRFVWLGHPRFPEFERQTYLNTIIEKNNTSEYYVEFEKFLSSHLVCAIVAFDMLNASTTRIDQFVAGYVQKLETLGFPTSKAAYETQEPYTELIGKRRHYYPILDEYKKQLVQAKGNTERFIKNSFPFLADGIAAGLLHTGINLGYAIRSENKNAIVEALAYIHHSYKPIRYTSGNVQNNPMLFGKGAGSFTAVLTELRKRKDYFIELQKNGEVVFRAPDSDWFSSTPQYRIASLLEHGDTIIEYVNMIKIEDDITSSDDLANWLLDQAIYMYAAAENKNDFVLLHGVTASWSLKQVVPYLSPAEVKRAIRDMLAVLLSVYIVQECPKMTNSPDSVSLHSIQDWNDIARQTAALDTDEHIYKVVAICKEHWLELSQKFSSAANYCSMAAKIATEHEIYWHSYSPAELMEDSIGVSGIRDNQF
jgi:2-polyprenyl-6-methoxyphenol hydroxylase-like FAD-dependent oxidoreductase